MARQKISSLKLRMPYVKDGSDKLTVVEQEVSFSPPVAQDKNKGKYDGNEGAYVYHQMKATIVIPEHIHQKLCGAFIPRRKEGTREREDGTFYTIDFPKIVTGYSLESVTKAYRDIILDYKFLVDLENTKMTKVIFFNFTDSIDEETKSSWDSTKMGKEVSITYGYIIGYISKDNKYFYNERKRLLDSRYNGFLENKWKYVVYTEERRMFFESTFQKFKDIITALKNFQDNVNDENIDNIIKSQPKLLHG